MIDFERGQGATEYLLMLAAVLVVVAAAVYFMMGTGPSFMITPAAGYPEMDAEDNSVIFTVDSVTPDNVEADIQILDHNGETDASTTEWLYSGKTVSLENNGTLKSGSKLQITAEGSTKTFDIDTT